MTQMKAYEFDSKTTDCFGTASLTVPVGFRFHPTEEELLNHYLKNKRMQGNNSRFDHIMPEIDVCKYEPTEIPALLVTQMGFETEGYDKEWFFFSKKDYKYNNSARSNRCTKQGYWKITGKERGIKARRSKAVIGKKRTLTFYQGRISKSKKSSWVIHEYYLPGTDAVSNPKQGQGDFVVCRLKNKPDKKDTSSICDEGELGSEKVVSNYENQAAEDMFQEVQENAESVFHPPQSLDDCSSAMQSPTSIELGDVLQANGTNNGWVDLQSNICKTTSSTIDEYNTTYAIFSELGETNQPEENMDLLFHPLQPQDYHPTMLQSSTSTKLGNAALQSPTYTKLGNVSHTNNVNYECHKWLTEVGDNDSQLRYTKRLSMDDYEKQSWGMSSTFGDGMHNTECNELQSPFGGNDFYNTSIGSQDYNSSGDTTHIPFGNFNLLESFGLVYDFGMVSDENNGDTNTEVVHGWVENSSALAIGETLKCS